MIKTLVPKVTSWYHHVTSSHCMMRQSRCRISSAEIQVPWARHADIAFEHPGLYSWRWVSLWYYSHYISCRLCMPKNGERTPGISFLSWKDKSLFRTDVWSKIIKDNRPKWSAKRKVAASERLHWHREATSPTSKWESSHRSLRPFATSAPEASMKFVYENGGLWLFSIRAISYNCCFLVLFRSNTKNSHDLSMTSICFNHPLPRAAVNRQM